MKKVFLKNIKKLFLITVVVFMLGVTLVDARTQIDNPLTTTKKVQGSWEATITVYADGQTYCKIGEKSNASDSVDSFDVPHPPFYPPGRAFVFIKQPSFPNPYKNLWMEYRHYTHASVIWNLTTYYLPFDEGGAEVLIQWASSEFLASGYTSVVLRHGAQSVNMLSCSSYSFHSEPYQMTYMKIYCSRPFSI